MLKERKGGQYLSTIYTLYRIAFFSYDMLRIYHLQLSYDGTSMYRSLLHMYLLCAGDTTDRSFVRYLLESTTSNCIGIPFVYKNHLRGIDIDRSTKRIANHPVGLIH